MTEATLDSGTQDQLKTTARIRSILNTIGDPCSVASGTPMGIEEMGLIKSVELDSDGHLRVAMRLTAPLCHNVGYFNVEIKNRLLAIDGVKAVDVTMDNGLDWTPADISEGAQRRRTATLRRHGIVSRVNRDGPIPGPRSG